MWTFSGNSFSWSRARGGDSKIWLYPQSHNFDPDLECQYPDFEYAEVKYLNGLSAYVVISEGDRESMISDIRESHRVFGYESEQGDPVEDLFATATLIGSEICVEICLRHGTLEQTLGDLFAATSRADGSYLLRIGSRLLDLTRSFGVKPEARSRFLSGELTAVIYGDVLLSYSIGNDLRARK